MKNAIILMIVMSLVIAGCTTKENEGGTPKPSAPLEANLEASDLSSDQFTLIFNVNPLLDEKKLSVNITLPENAELINGSLKQDYIGVKAGDRISHKLIVKLKQEGNYTITAWASSNWNPSDTYGKKSEICFTKKNGNLNKIDCTPLLPQSDDGEVKSESLWLDDPFKGTFEGSDKPKFGSEMNIVFSLTPEEDFDQLNVTLFLLTKDVKLLEGDLQWAGSAIKGQKIEIPLKIYVEDSKCIGSIRALVSAHSNYDASIIIDRSYYYAITPGDCGANTVTRNVTKPDGSIAEETAVQEEAYAVE